MDMLAAMRVFQKVAAALSFTEAGDLLGLSPSSVSRHIDSLEAYLGVKLLTRTTRRLALTEIGMSYKSRVDVLLADLDEMNESVAASSDELQGKLKVSSPRVFGRRVLTPLVPDFLKVCPKVTLELSMTDDYVDLIETDTDVAIRIGMLEDSSLLTRPLGQYRRVLVCHRDYLTGRAPLQHPTDLAHFNCLRYRRQGERVVWRFSGQDGGATVEVTPTGDFLSNEVEALLTATLAGAGISVLPYWLVRDSLDAGSLIQLLPDFPLIGSLHATGIHFVYPLSRRQSKKVQSFVQHVIDHTRSLLD